MQVVNYALWTQRNSQTLEFIPSFYAKDLSQAINTFLILYGLSKISLIMFWDSFVML